MGEQPALRVTPRAASPAHSASTQCCYLELKNPPAPVHGEPIGAPIALLFVNNPVTHSQTFRACVAGIECQAGMGLGVSWVVATLRLTAVWTGRALRI